MLDSLFLRSIKHASSSAKHAVFSCPITPSAPQTKLPCQKVPFDYTVDAIRRLLERVCEFFGHMSKMNRRSLRLFCIKTVIAQLYYHIVLDDHDMGKGEG